MDFCFSLLLIRKVMYIFPDISRGLHFSSFSQWNDVSSYSHITVIDCLKRIVFNGIIKEPSDLCG